ncbi:MAG: S9 family peptidase [Bacteroidaceae bacterium]|nr:S9 family peptidase [Bacteroidaceae bacterium]
MKQTSIVISLLAMPLMLAAETIDVTSIRLAGPYSITKPLMTDTLDNEGKLIDLDEVYMESPLPAPPLGECLKAETSSLIALPKRGSGEGALYFASFTMQNTGFAKGKVNVKCESKHKLFIDGNEQSGDFELVPGRHEVGIKILVKPSRKGGDGGGFDTLRISVESEQSLEINPEGKRYWTNADMMHGERINGVELSSSGKYVRIRKSITYKGGETASKDIFMETATGREFNLEGFQYWLPEGDRYLRSYREAEGTWCYETVDPKTGERTFVGKYSGKGHAYPTKDLKHFLVTIEEKEAEEKNKDVHQILEPDDRQPGWRKRRNYSLYDIETGITTPITKGARNVYVTPNKDASRFLVSIYKEELTERPFEFTDLLLFDPATGKADTLIRHDGFLSKFDFSPDGKSLVITGSPEALGGIGNTLPAGVTPSSYEYELFVMDLQTKDVRCLTRDFDPSVVSYQWSEQDGMIYALCEDRDMKSLYRIETPSNSPSRGRKPFPIEGEGLGRGSGAWEMISLSEPYIYSSYSLAKEKPLLAYIGESSMSTDRCWLRDLKTGKEKILCDLNPTRLKDIQLGECHDWNFRAERGDTIYGCYYLPPFFDETKQYPMLVYYYGGCSPVGRYLDSYYNYQEWAAMGYVVYVIQPSGCSGFGQEFASRHVNAYGDYTADDIIQGTKQFCKEHPFIKTDKIGCMGASYGGFMTMYLQTVTDIFAAAMSHAGISNPASYWGYGYWGYSYSTTSAAHSYPWNNMELYSGHAPLFNADKVHTPILFMHGGADTNVPINESIQMFTALKLLGRECAFITVEGENHHILNYNKRIRWHDSIMAWFAKWLQDDPTWWNTMYPEKNLK